MVPSPLELRPIGPSSAHLAVEGGRLVGYGRRGERVELGSGCTLWIFQWDGRDCLAVLDRRGAGLLTFEAEFCPYQARRFADRHGLALWLGALTRTEPRLRLARATRVRAAWRPPHPRTPRRVRRWAAAHGLIMTG